MSTTGITGHIPDEGHILFTEYDYDLGQQLENIYSKTKFESERLVYESSKKGLNANIFRIGNIGFDSKTGTFQDNIGENAIFMLLKALVKLGVLPDMKQNTIELSFVDFVSKAIVKLLEAKNLKNETYHVFNPNFLSIFQIGTVIKNLGYNVSSLQQENYLDYLYEVYTDDGKADLTTFVDTLFLNLGIFDERISSTRYSIVADKTNFLLNRMGFQWIEIDNAHLIKMIEHCRKVNFF
jgi:thioester reductase-like protein